MILEHQMQTAISPDLRLQSLITVGLFRTSFRGVILPCPTLPISITCPRWTSSTHPPTPAWRRGCRPIRHLTCLWPQGLIQAHAANTLVLHYVQALAMRRKLHTAGALFSGKQPNQVALVPGGVTTLFSSTYPLTPQSGTDYDMYGPYNASDTTSKFKSLMMDVRNFINQSYIPDVVTVANHTGIFFILEPGRRLYESPCLW